MYPVVLAAGLLAGGVHAGVGYVDYATNQFDGGDGFDLTGASLWVDADLGLRQGAWTFGGFFSFIWHSDHNTGPTPDGAGTYDVHLHIYELGVRATWHRHALSLGAGVMPSVLARPYGRQTVELGPLDGGGTYVATAPEWEHMPAAELHAGYDLSALTDRVALQLFALVEVGDSFSDLSPAGSMTSVRVGVGATF